MRPLHQINPLRLEYVCNQLEAVSPEECRILDVGCGGGLFSLAMAERGYKTTGIDVGKDLIKVAQGKAEERKLKLSLQATSLEAFAKKKRQNLFDVVCCFEVLEHVADPDQWLTHAASLVKPGGLLVCSTINRNPRAFVEAIIGAEYVLGLIPKGTHHYAQLIKPSELTAWLRACKLETIDITGLSYKLFAQDFYLSADTAVNYFLTAKK
jgi:2-polyprenyl-6-hydroxyphenyl methylase / 3-demethylubiquinone-9 3-methyltransferase